MDIQQIIKKLLKSWYATFIEKTALYANDVVLFLDDPTTSFPQALSILDHIATFSGLRVNWHKSTILARGKDVCQSAIVSTSLQWVSKVKYLGLTITNLVSDFLWLNVTPITTIFKQQIGAWQNHPLSLIGRGELNQNETVTAIAIKKTEKLARTDPQSYF